MIASFYRLFIINLTLARFGLDEIILSIHLFAPLRFLVYLNPYNWFRDKSISQAERLRLCIESLGPIFIKFGQLLATRRDLLDDELINELEKLLDRVPPFPVAQARSIIEKELKQPLDEAFTSFDENVLASASIAQVHGAVMNDGREVIVKIVRPNIEKAIRKDIALLMMLARLADRYWVHAKRVKPIKVVEEFEKTLINELDLVREAANASELRRHFIDSEDLYVPEIFWDYCKTNMLVMERIDGIPATDIKQLNEHGMNLEILSRKGVEVFFTQVYNNNFFHADMHPGNIFVSRENPENPKYIAVDFGIMGSLSTTDQRYLAENFVAFFNRDYRKVAELHVDSGWVDAATRIDDFESAIRAVCEPMFQRPLAEISFGQLLLRLFETAHDFNMEIQPQLLLLQKTLLHIEGMGRQLYPQLDLWDTAKPFLERWLSEQMGLRAMAKGFKRNLPFLAENLPDLPQLAFKALDKVANDKLEIEWKSKQLEEIKKEIKIANRRTVRAIAGSSLIISSALIAGLDGIAPTMIGSGVLFTPVISIILLVPGLMILVSLMNER
ncbi:MAG: ubiquinone biosynthesis regulatory protein kinase UbiB [Gammaproteobacteria bacterium]|jgi:ubiquinone biosynthesis protein|nr:ubiquinone biosynthesis regulatory protein kinase UbiB [Gammaproteobacteria bacterium]MBT3722729.1 ubiquinone biosynthesis regulatory protein kinase UbiB [Gammaproteobacteria bacterium]MBT4452234.1 ubiquinone biosynthesis regulatory protein kinase UbiB [Gammaproteobacteria bacterium]MBT6551358.1 ubiquinone biosynthesis regulatory protein kinase UbiB [Gammaproteobacteria bacterium]MBT7047079.1 ubiquinone biosynthesis regulatory protein kinase UbiB [Gammaproteobacteria bacterium]